MIGHMFFKDGSIKKIVDARLKEKGLIVIGTDDEMVYAYHRETNECWVYYGQRTLFADAKEWHSLPDWRIIDTITAIDIGISISFKEGS